MFVEVCGLKSRGVVGGGGADAEGARRTTITDWRRFATLSSQHIIFIEILTYTISIRLIKYASTRSCIDTFCSHQLSIALRTSPLQHILVSGV